MSNTERLSQKDEAATNLSNVTTSSAINVNTETYLYKHITTAAPTNYACKTGSGKLHTIAVNKHTDAAVLTIYDGTDATGAVIGVLTLVTAAAGTPAVNPTRIYDVGFNDGLFIVASGAAADFTVSYK